MKEIIQIKEFTSLKALNIFLQLNPVEYVDLKIDENNFYLIVKIKI